MFNPQRQLIIDIKGQDRLREWFANRNSGDQLSLQCVQLGDSDIDYELGYKSQDIRVLNAPYQTPGIKSKLVYSGLSQNITGKLGVYGRYVDANGNISGLYNFPPDATNLILGATPPTLTNGFSRSDIPFSNSTREGWVLFIETLPDNLIDNNGNQLRLLEQYEITASIIPTNFELIEDTVNGSFMLAHNQLTSLVGPQLFTAMTNGTAEANVSGLTGSGFSRWPNIKRSGNFSLRVNRAITGATTLWTHTSNIILDPTSIYILKGYVFVPDTSISSTVNDLKIRSRFIGNSNLSIVSLTEDWTYIGLTSLGSWYEVLNTIITGPNVESVQIETSVLGNDASILSNKDIFFDDYTIFKSITTLPGNNIGTIDIRGKISNISKQITFNY